MLARLAPIARFQGPARSRYGLVEGLQRSEEQAKAEREGRCPLLFLVDEKRKKTRQKKHRGRRRSLSCLFFFAHRQSFLFLARRVLHVPSSERVRVQSDATPGGISETSKRRKQLAFFLFASLPAGAASGGDETSRGSSSSSGDDGRRSGNRDAPRGIGRAREGEAAGGDAARGQTRGRSAHLFVGSERSESRGVLDAGMRGGLEIVESNRAKRERGRALSLRLPHNSTFFLCLLSTLAPPFLPFSKHFQKLLRNGFLPPCRSPAHGTLIEVVEGKRK